MSVSSTESQTGTVTHRSSHREREFLGASAVDHIDETALRMLRLLPHGLDFVLEALCATWRECVSLRRRTDVPIIFDELATDDASIVQLVAEDAAEGIGLKISKNGGLTRGRRHRDIRVAAGHTVSVQETTGSDIAFAAIVHLGHTVPERYLRCVLESRDIVSLKKGRRSLRRP
ncbi:L-alanine-DL-glutamate epimerase-like enolase superfamily enzyme [Sinorhizobium fredii]|nr:enolase C-terminal domain-like protein [Sinorhizobium fredii]GEC32572.1 hypothetical protein EFR01_27430 [Sinorhizobium fredii]GLS08144.1 hypothetical protein GCM10007864_17730 [Sinorhizobium fredii]